MFVERHGHGAPLALLHGWGLNRGVWRPLLDALESDFQVHLIDHPGHGASPPPAPGELDFAAPAAAAVTVPAIWVGWSLGALVALEIAARYPQRVRALVLLAGSPRFVAGSGWPALDPAELTVFEAQLAADPEAALERFLLRVTLGCRGRRERVRQLRAALRRCGAPHPHGLHAGLAQLARIDRRDTFAALQVPLHVVLGEGDPLVPGALVPVLRRLNPAARVSRLAGAGHLPMLAAPECLPATLRALAAEAA